MTIYGINAYLLRNVFKGISLSECYLCYKVKVIVGIFFNILVVNEMSKGNMHHTRRIFEKLVLHPDKMSVH